MDLDDTMLSDISQSQKGKYCVIPLTGDAIFTDPGESRFPGLGERGVLSYTT